MITDDETGGTLQRFMWFPATAPRVDSQRPSMLAPLRLREHDAWRHSRAIKIPYEATELICDTQARQARGEVNHLDGHALFAREKFAYALAVLDGRDEMNLDDWRLAGIASRVSDRTREWVRYELDQERQRDAEKRGALTGVWQQAASDTKAKILDDRAAKRGRRIAKNVLDKLNAAGTDGLPNRDLKNAIAFRDRSYLPEVFDDLERTGRVKHDEEANHWYLANCSTRST